MFLTSDTYPSFGAFSCVQKEIIESSASKKGNGGGAKHSRDDDVPPLEAPSLEPAIRPVPWIDPLLKFYAISSRFNLARSICFQEGRIYGQDASSGAAVAALLSTQHDDDDVNRFRDDEVAAETEPTGPPVRVLDLCCCPGLKLCAIADYLCQQQKQTRSRRPAQVIGVDVSATRMALCRRVVQKYQVHAAVVAPNGKHEDAAAHIQLYCQDGTQLGLDGASSAEIVFDSHVAMQQVVHCGKRRRLNKSGRSREQRSLREVLVGQSFPFERESFDYVIVDAECSSDGSIRHVQQRAERTGQNDLENPLLTDSKRLEVLVRLQRELIVAGFRMLRPGGSMIYSTCSLSWAQNEGVVEWLLRSQPASKLVPLSFGTHPSSSQACAAREVSHIIDKNSDTVSQGELQGTVRFLPVTVQQVKVQRDDDLSGDGFFLAKITKADSGF
jgi:16S rRNA C967 or C1407 C5-methylase (RsmB/RsmF family)